VSYDRLKQEWEWESPSLVNRYLWDPVYVLSLRVSYRGGRKGGNMERLKVDEMRISREEGGRGMRALKWGLITALSEPHPHPCCPLGSLPSFSSLTTRFPRKPHIVAISVQCPCVSAFLSCSCLIDTRNSQDMFPRFLAVSAC
jgi:hypothetical protein